MSVLAVAVTSVSVDEIASLRFPQKIFFKRKLTFTIYVFFLLKLNWQDGTKVTKQFLNVTQYKFKV